jgi:glycosyltransferase involved in cell wall biosynthesis
VVATDVGGNAEAVLEGVSGLIVPPEDADALASALMRLLEDPQLASAMGTAGRQRAEEKFTTDAMMREVTETFTELLRA